MESPNCKEPTEELVSKRLNKMRQKEHEGLFLSEEWFVGPTERLERSRIAHKQLLFETNRFSAKTWVSIVF